MSLRTLSKLGFDPRFCIDVGAYHGEWTRLFKIQFPASKVLMIEAQDSKRGVLNEVAACFPNDVLVQMALLGPHDGSVVEFSEMETGSSVFPENSHFPRAKTTKKTCRLDTLISRGNYPQADFIKLDVQGYELEILKGASAVLASAAAVLLEASLISINTGCPAVSEVIHFMDTAGFRLFDFCSQIRRKDGVLWQTDLLFIRSDSAIMPTADLTPDNWGV